MSPVSDPVFYRISACLALIHRGWSGRRAHLKGIIPIAAATSVTLHGVTDTLKPEHEKVSIDNYRTMKIDNYRNLPKIDNYRNLILKSIITVS